MALSVTIVNGSPHGEHSHTMVFAKAFVRGMSENEDVNVSTVNVYAADIRFCDACMSCIVERQGVCSIHDDMDTILPKLVNSDVVIWAVPLMNSSVPAKLKVLIERLMPIYRPQVCTEPSGKQGYGMRYNNERIRNILISSSGFTTLRQNYEPLQQMFMQLYPQCDQILIPGSRVLIESDPKIKARVSEYLQLLARAGTEYCGGGITPATRNALSVPIMTAEDYIRQFNQYLSSRPGSVNAGRKWAD